MPLTALLHGNVLRAPQLSATEWSALRGADLVMPCGARGIAKRSALGTRFFAHHPGEHCGVDHKPESVEHLAAKEAIIGAALAAGWSAEDERRAPDGTWVADVLVSNGTRRIAFEVQWSHQHEEDYRSRTQRYAADGIETVWFARHPSSRLDSVAPVIELLQPRDGDHEPMVKRPGSEGAVALGAVVRALLNDDVVRAPSQPAVSTTIAAWGLEECWRCHEFSVIFSPSSIEAARCDDCGLSTYRDRRLTAFAHAVREASQSGLGGAVADVPMAELAMRSTKAHPSGEVGFRCPHCKATFGWNFVDQLWDDPAAGRLRVVVGEGTVSEHWCRRGAPHRRQEWSVRPAGDWRANASSRRYRIARERLVDPRVRMSPWAHEAARLAVNARRELRE